MDRHSGAASWPSASSRRWWSAGACRRSKIRSPLAKAAYEQKDWSKAADFARVRLKADGGDLDALRILARSSIRLGRDGAGAAIYNDRLGAEGMQPEDRYLAGPDARPAGRRGTGPEGVGEGRGRDAAISRSCLLSLANMLARKQRLDEAARLAERLSTIPGWEAAGSLLLGTNRFSLEDYSAAADSLRRGLELDPEGRAGPPRACRSTARSWRGAC